MGLTVAVTGSTGFLGRPLCAALAGRGHTVRAFTRSASIPFGPGVTPFSLRDLDDTAALRAGCSGVDSVVPLAARTHVLHDTATDPEGAYHHINVVGTRNVIEAAVAGGAAHFVMLS